MLKLSQVKQLLLEHLHIRTSNGRVVWEEDGLGFTDGRTRLLHAESADETGEDWREVLESDEPSLYLITVNHHYGGHFHVIQSDGASACTKVVKFDNPIEPPANMRKLPHYVVIDSLEEMTDEDACEMAIDEVLKFKGFDEANAQPQLVI